MALVVLAVCVQIEQARMSFFTEYMAAVPKKDKADGDQRVCKLLARALEFLGSGKVNFSHR